MATKKEVADVLLLCLNAELKNHDISSLNMSAKIDAYHSVLSDMPNDVLLTAAKFHISKETFFPTPGKLRECAMELQMLALGIPIPGEAWAQVLGANQYREPVYCDRGMTLRSLAENPDNYWGDVSNYDQHVKGCDTCTSGGIEEVYAHPAVRETVRLLGGRANLMTDNPMADRSRFQKSYEEVVKREKTLQAMPGDVKLFLEDERSRIQGDIALLGEGMRT